MGGLLCKSIFKSLSQKPPQSEGEVSFVAVSRRVRHMPEIHLIHLINLFFYQYSVFVTDSSDMGGCESLRITLSSRVLCLSIRHGSIRRDSLLLKNTPTRKRQCWSKRKLGSSEGALYKECRLLCHLMWALRVICITSFLYSTI